MSEIKTIKGKVEFVCVPFEGDYERKCHLVTRYVHPNLDPNETLVGFLLSEITEEQASLLVCKFGKNAFREYGCDDDYFCITAKESLFSLLKANGCWIKEWKEKPIGRFVDTENDIVDWNICKAKIDYRNAPDDYLLIIKQ